ncbi:Type IV secretion system protein virB5 (plasmid) [Janthinobacterium sp. HH102]|uniref:P-type DNA transfer protein VirB5 n=1 Tax=Janthinobacterium sp. HH102 TaxID=1537274 RepID=UPI0008740287|nr:P-type DNA transfer protein VirB5 [Janthinobacterium sp. HH102]QOU76440.1 Type IV secretion system protein virB5 [Janthinobacterium sp. HH102]
MFAKLSAFMVGMMVYGTSIAQIPVTDVAMNSQTVANQAANLAKYVEQLSQLKMQLDQAKTTYNSISGLRNIGSMMKNDLLKQYLPADYQKAYDLLKAGKAGSLSGISGSLNEIAASYQAKECDANTTASCKKAWQTLAMNQFVGEQGYKQAAQNIANLEAFVNKIGTSPDPKSLQDLQARIAVEQVKMQNEQIKLQTLQMTQKAQEDMQRRNSHDRSQQMLQTETQIRF